MSAVLAEERAGGYTPPMQSFLKTGFLLAAALFFVSCTSSDSGDTDVPDITGPCAGRNQRCTSSADCCGTQLCNANKVCSNGDCQGKGTRCTSSSQCCGSYACTKGVCGGGSAACVGRGASCGASSDCCGTLTCSDGQCTDGGCGGQGSQCTTASQCCGILTCSGGLCR